MSAIEWGALLFSHPLLFCRSVMAFGSKSISVLLKWSLEGCHQQMGWKQGPLATLYSPFQTTAHGHNALQTVAVLHLALAAYNKRPAIVQESRESPR